MSVLATVANMHRYYRPSKKVGDCIVFPNQPFAYSLNTGERYSANPSDYWSCPEDDPLLDSDGEPMILVFEITKIVDADKLDD